MLKKATLTTSVNPSSCGNELELGAVYLIAGTTERITLCSFVMKFDNMTLTQQRGFAGEYSEGCACDPKPFWNDEHGAPRDSLEETDECKWYIDKPCDKNHGLCVPEDRNNAYGPITCQWRATDDYKKCLEFEMN